MHHDLGVINAPVLLFGGPYSNVHAVEALFAEAARLQIAGCRMICTGDVVAYCGAPAATVAMLRQAGAAVVAGNCEKQLARHASGCGCGFEAGSACDLLSMGWYRFADDRVDDAARDWMAGCADILSFRHQGARYAVLHGGMTDIARFIWPNSGASVFEAEWCAIERAIGPVDHVIAGHCGLAFIRPTPRGRWINPGVIGMPPNDGHQHTRYGVLDGGEVQMHRLSYDAKAASAMMQASGLTQGYDTALLSGYWPSEDILPPSLRGLSLASG